MRFNVQHSIISVRAFDKDMIDLSVARSMLGLFCFSQRGLCQHIVGLAVNYLCMTMYITWTKIPPRPSFKQEYIYIKTTYVHEFDM